MKLNLGKNKIITLKAYGLKIKIRCKFRVMLIKRRFVTITIRVKADDVRDKQSVHVFI
jgi:hypothetical protein